MRSDDRRLHISSWVWRSLVLAVVLALGVLISSKAGAAPAGDGLGYDITGLGLVLATAGLEESAQSLAELIDGAGEMGYAVDSPVLGVDCYYVEDAYMRNFDGVLLGFGLRVDIQTIDNLAVITGYHLMPYAMSGKGDEPVYLAEDYRSAYDMLVSDVLNSVDESMVLECDAVVPYYVVGAEYRDTVIGAANGDVLVFEYISFDDQASYFSVNYYSPYHAYMTGTAQPSGPPSLHCD